MFCLNVYAFRTLDMSVHLGFDMGIRNLAYCLLRHESSGEWTIVAWDNVDLLAGGVSAQTAKQCCACSNPARYVAPDSTKWCKGCATGVRVKKNAKAKPPVPVLPCERKVKPLRDLTGNKTMKKEELFQLVSTKYLIPWKPERAADSSLTIILGAMNTWLDSILPTFSSASLIRLENQPVMKGPTMKSVQIILFTLLSHRLRREYDWKGTIEFVHAGTKSKHVAQEAKEGEEAKEAKEATESEAYRVRKRTAENDVLDLLSKQPTMATWLEFFQSRSKKSDLADALLMAFRK